MKFTDEEGKVWEWRGGYRPGKRGEYVLQGTSGVHPSLKTGIGLLTQDATGDRAILYPVHPIHEFGGVRFEETGERRVVQKGEWYLPIDEPQGGVHFRHQSSSFADYIILRPLQGE